MICSKTGAKIKVGDTLLLQGNEYKYLVLNIDDTGYATVRCMFDDGTFSGYYSGMRWTIVEPPLVYKPYSDRSYK